MATEAARKSPLAGKCESNIHAKEWVLIAPDGQVYRVRNLYNFVRENTHLFAPVDTIWKRRGGKEGQAENIATLRLGLRI